jgi:serine phosphatase RsbU (regulator of sigma subunit)
MKLNIITFLLSAFFILIFSNFVFTQNSQIEILEKKLETATQTDQLEMYNELIDLYLDLDLVKAESYAILGLNSAQLLNKTEIIADFYAKLGTIQIESFNYKSAIENLEKEYKIRKKLNDFTDISICLYNLGTAYSKKGNKKKAIESYELCIVYSQKSGSQVIQEQIYFTLYDLYYQNKDYFEALEYYKIYINIYDSTFKTQSNQEMIVLRKIKEEQENQIETKDSLIILKDSTISNVVGENSELTKITVEQDEVIEELNIEKAYNEEKLKSHRLQLNILLISIISIIMISILLLNRFLYKSKINKQLTLQNALIKQQNEEIIVQSEEIEKHISQVEIQRDEIIIKNKHITDSINYAKKIQTAALPEYSYIKTLFPNSFIIFKPRDIISGDFYWVNELNNKIIALVADCTGHGVPGAFVSMLGISLLNEIFHRDINFSACEILDNLRNEIKHSLKQNDEGSSSQDGMDIALTITDLNNSRLEYSGANNSMYLIRNGELKEYKSTKNPIGIYLKEKPFENNVIDILKNDEIFLFSDGIPDQVGGEKTEKFKYYRFRELIINASKVHINEQAQFIENTLEKWAENQDQVDDITILGFVI